MCYITSFGGKHGEIAQSDSDIELIQKLFDAYKGLQRFIKPLLGHGDEADKDNEFDAKLRKVWDELDIITPLYDKVRNWLSRKIYNPEKIKLCFENNGKLLSGWSDNQTKSDNGTQYGGYIFRKKNEIGEYDFIWVSLQMLSCFVVMKLSVMKMVCMKDLITIT